MSIRARVLAVVGAFGTLYLSFYLGTGWGPPLLDIGCAPSATSKQTWITQDTMDDLPKFTPNAWNEESYGDVIGIELGNDYSRVGIYKNDQFVLIASDEGQTKIPNYVTLTDQGVITGLKAKEQADDNTENTIYDFRRLLGRRFPDTSLQQEITLLPYKVLEKDCRPFIQVQINGTEKLYSPEEITAEILKRMKTAAEHLTFNRISHAVITVPSYFNDAQRQATKDASAIAGLNVLRLMDEPRAAGLAYELDKIKRLERKDSVWKELEGLHGNALLEAPAINYRGFDDEYCYLVFNIEERGCDLTITSVDYGVFELLGNLTSDFGTRDFDHDVFRYLFNLAHEGVAQFDISEDFESIDRLNLEVKQAQETLLRFPSAKVNVSSHDGENILSTIVTREIVQDLHAEGSDYKVVGLVEKALFDAKLEKGAIDGLIVTGDPVYAAKIQPILQGYFEDAKLHSDIKSDEVVVRGVALMAGILSDEYLDGCDFYPIDLLPLSVGIETAGGLYTKVILRNSIVPTRKTKLVLPAGDSQEKVVLKIYEGERELVKYNRYLGSLELDGLSRTQSGELEIEVAFVVTPEFKLIVTAKEKDFDHEVEVVFDDGTLRHDRWQEEVDDILMEAEKTYEADLQEKAKAIAEDSWKQDKFGVLLLSSRKEN